MSNVIVPTGVSGQPAQYNSDNANLENLSNELTLLNLGSVVPLNIKIDCNQFMSEIKLFPNPAKDNLMVTLSNFEEMGSVTYSIVNAIGQVVYTGAIISNETSINISSLNSGMYYFKTSDQTTKPIIFVVQ
jgi:hypothetical protein